MPKKRRYKKAFVILLFAFLVYNLLWFANYSTYAKYTKNEGIIFSMKLRHSYLVEDEFVTYTVKKPDYLVFHGNLASVNEDDSIRIIVWPSYFCKFIDGYGLMLYDHAADAGYVIYVDENMEFHPRNYQRLSPDVANSALLLLERKKEAVLAQFELMKQEFEI